MTTLFIVAGETSGDIHGANLARALRELQPDIRLVGAGGPRMREAGVNIVIDPVEHAAVGIAEALHNMHYYARLYRLLLSALRQHKPGVVVLIDFPDFNLRFAERVKDHAIPIVYYISPQLWAWREGRVKTIKRLVRKMIVILDFEAEFYRKHGVDAVFVGHPLLDAERTTDPAAFRRELGVPDKAPLIGLLPGSRSKQFATLHPLMEKTATLIQKERPDARFVIACARSIDPKKAKGDLPFVWDRTPEVMTASDLLITASGTATLEAAIYGTPMIVTYKINPITALAFAPLLKVKDFALVNIVASQRIMPEYYQFKAKPHLIAREALSILRENRLPEMRRHLADVRKKLGGPGASKRAATEVLRVLDDHPAPQL